MRKIVALSALMLGVALAGPRQNNVIIGASQEPPAIQDYWSTNNLAISSEINGYTTSSLTVKNDAGQLVADLAERVPTAANGDIKTTRQGNRVTSNSVTYRIRPNARWSDGTQITVRDFQFWLEVQNDERVPVPTREPWNTAKITRVNDKTFTVTFTPAYLFADQVGPGYAPAHIMQADWNAFKTATAQMDAKSQGKEINERWQQFLGRHTTATGLPKVSSGAFRLTAWRAGSSMTLVRNPNYWRKPPGDEKNYAQQVIFRFIGDTNTLRVNVLSGQIDALATVGVTFDQGLELQKSEGNRFKTFFVPGGVWEHIDINKFANVQKVKDLNLDDKRIRQALLMSINRDSLVQQLYQGKQPVSHSFVSTLSSLYKQDVQKYPYNPDRAKQLFAAAGWTPGSDGILQKDGKKFQINFTTTAGNRIRERVQQILIAQWKAVGVDVQVANQPASVVFSEDFIQRASEGRWDMFMFAWVQDPALETGNLYSAETQNGDPNIPTSANGYAGQNIGGWNNAEFNGLYKQALQAFEAAPRKTFFDRMQTIWAEEIPTIPLYNRANPYTKATGLVNYTFSASNLYPSWNAYQIGWSQNGAREVNVQR
ncbi:peptide ABC transporter substrate-binding protein [Deinococcus peraridilitoris]|uniref:ABC-type dipeptide transport system, periplasmic component n=1 Tax=Deinococcus peraridilitoris (strain DSM 19664 / LMG 22246 / CIP 109416 / KR-200) TaxID=937777 RepID=K9ZZR6_DEIPD|nr:peptide ABC transporter substrate-binding protein [Deinococcus peraridilitoris]AFZ66684.1 ABC-type dipeptide transport system, periplasmic component [Deinococcus peraridilitoris DSM 19664]